MGVGVTKKGQPWCRAMHVADSDSIKEGEGDVLEGVGGLPMGREIQFSRSGAVMYQPILPICSLEWTGRVEESSRTALLAASIAAVSGAAAVVLVLLISETPLPWSLYPCSMLCKLE